MPEREPVSECSPIAPDDSIVHQIQSILLDWGRTHFQEFPWRSPEQKWHGLVAEILLQRTRAQNVIPVYMKFIETFPKPEMLGNSSVEKIEEIIYPLGLRWRAPLLKELGVQLSELQEKLPVTEHDLRQLHGVGPYAASAFLSLHTNTRAVIIDANVVRFVGRLSGCPVDAETRRKAWLITYVEKITPQDNIRDFNYALLDFTMKICTLTPKCDSCPIGERYCSYRRLTLKRSIEK